MTRDQFTVEIRRDGADIPTLYITAVDDGRPPDDRLTSEELTASDIDAAFRLREAAGDIAGDTEPREDDEPDAAEEADDEAETGFKPLTDDGDETGFKGLTEENEDSFSADIPDGAAETGVFSLTHRMTGSYLLEVTLPVDALFELVETARTDTDEPTYRITVDIDEPITYELDALFVYDSEGDLRRQDSLIPSGVEL